MESRMTILLPQQIERIRSLWVDTVLKGLRDLMITKRTEDRYLLFRFMYLLTQDTGISS
jgi:hypothetical protein